MAPILEFDSIDSTNNYAMQLIDANKAETGLLVLANTQTDGKGQRGKQWVTTQGEALLMSILLKPCRTLQQQTQFMTAVAVAVANVCERRLPEMPVSIKWPNDIIISDKKAGGILIENVIRGNSWEWCVIGIGLNTRQQSFPVNLPFATSLAAQGAQPVQIKTLAIEMRAAILGNLAQERDFLTEFNERLYQRGVLQLFCEKGREFYGRVDQVTSSGLLDITEANGSRRSLLHGEVEWVW